MLSLRQSRRRVRAVAKPPSMWNATQHANACKISSTTQLCSVGTFEFKFHAASHSSRALLIWNSNFYAPLWKPREKYKKKKRWNNLLMILRECCLRRHQRAVRGAVWSKRLRSSKYPAKTPTLSAADQSCASLFLVIQCRELWRIQRRKIRSFCSWIFPSSIKAHRPLFQTIRCFSWRFLNFEIFSHHYENSCIICELIIKTCQSEVKNGSQ